MVANSYVIPTVFVDAGSTMSSTIGKLMVDMLIESAQSIEVRTTPHMV